MHGTPPCRAARAIAVPSFPQLSGIVKATGSILPASVRIFTAMLHIAMTGIGDVITSDGKRPPLVCLFELGDLAKKSKVSSFVGFIWYLAGMNQFHKPWMIRVDSNQ